MPSNNSELVAWLGLGLDAALIAVFYKLYKVNSRAADDVKRAKSLTIGDEIVKELELATDHRIAYACVEGVTASVGKPLASHYKDGFQGVIQQISLVEHKSKRVQGYWSDVKNVLRDTVDVIPFLLHGMNGSKHSVHVMEPTEANLLMDDLSVTYDHFEPQQATFMQRGMDRLFGDVSKGLHETEKMLLVDTCLLGIGEIVLEDGRIKLIPPQNGAKYILTKLSKREVIGKLESKSFWYKAIAAVLGVVGGGLLFFLVRKYVLHWKSVRRQQQVLAEIRTARQQRGEARQTPSGGQDEGFDATVCVVCLTNPREVVLLNCGHICICTECVAALPHPQLCPVCRNNIDRILPTYTP